MRLRCSALARLAAVAAAGWGFAAAGCGPDGKPMGTVAGRVTYKGQPVTEGEVEVVNTDFAVGAIVRLDATGRFEVDVPVPAGVYSVAVAPPRFVEGKTFPNIPRRARALATSGLTVTVNPGKNEADIELKD